MVTHNMHNDIEAFVLKENFHWRKVSIKLPLPIAIDDVKPVCPFLCLSVCLCVTLYMFIWSCDQLSDCWEDEAIALIAEVEEAKRVVN